MILILKSHKNKPFESVRYQRFCLNGLLRNYKYYFRSSYGDAGEDIIGGYFVN